jgi:uncharacterized tellurite resistance protein B-like protein
MITSLKAFIDRYFVEPSADPDPEHNLQIASAALMVEMMFADHACTPAEEQVLHELLAAHFELSTEETTGLLQLAHQEKHAATDYFQFTSLLNQHYSQQQKIELVEFLWEIAYADNELDKLEEHLIRRLADLLHVPHADFMQAKHRAMQARS